MRQRESSSAAAVIYIHVILPIIPAFARIATQLRRLSRSSKYPDKLIFILCLISLRIELFIIIAMPDINELLRWSIANSTAPDADASEQLQIRFNPNSTQSGTSTLHASDLGPPDISPASTPGPATPRDGSSLPLPPGAEVPGAKKEDLTTEMLDLILGKGDSITMKEKMAFAIDENNSVEDRVEALDDFEMVCPGLPFDCCVGLIKDSCS